MKFHLFFAHLYQKDHQHCLSLQRKSTTMFPNKKFNLFAAFLFLVLLQSCRTSDEPGVLALTGETMGTYWKVSYQDANNRNFKKEIDALLVEVNNEVSTYEPNSVISQFNKAKTSLKIADVKRIGADSGVKRLYPHFSTNYTASKMIFNASKAYFDPTVMPLVNYWGFGYEGKKPVTDVDSVKIQSILPYVGLNKIEEHGDQNEVFLIKPSPQMELDFGGIAKGYGVDVVGKFLESNNIQNYLVDIGGELRARGAKSTGSWKAGINTPSSDAALTDIEVILNLKNISMATSGNYRNFHEVNGKKYSHTINPKTGFPELNSLLSATVASVDCVMADGFATAFMTMGLENAKKIVENTNGVEAYFIYSDESGTMKTYHTAYFKDIIQESK